jgi:hypothetical protein
MARYRLLLVGIAAVALLLAGVLLAGCGQRAAKAAEAAEAPGAQTQSAAPEPRMGFAAQVVPIFAAKCNFCHHPGNAVEVDLTRPFHPDLGLIMRPNTWTRSEKKHLVVPGDPEASALVLKVERTDLDPKVDGDPMPWNIPPLTERELADLRRWIGGGAKADELYQGVIRRIFGDGVSLGSRGGKCAYCHVPGVIPPDLANPFDAVGGAVGVAAASGQVRIVPGDPEASLLFEKVKGEPLRSGIGRPMPLHFDRLTESERRSLRDWISAGALND